MTAQNNTFKQRKTLDVNSEKKHKADLGLSIPENYFSKSKESILKQTVGESKGKVVALSRRIYLWASVAVVACLVTLTIYKFSPVEQVVNETDILIASMMADDDEVEMLVDQFVKEELLTEEVFLE